jgi:hypothetical protein
MGHKRKRVQEPNNSEEFIDKKHTKTTHLNPDEKKLIVVLSGAQLETVKVGF